MTTTACCAKYASEEAESIPKPILLTAVSKVVLLLLLCSPFSPQALLSDNAAPLPSKPAPAKATSATVKATAAQPGTSTAAAKQAAAPKAKHASSAAGASAAGTSAAAAAKPSTIRGDAGDEEGPGHMLKLGSLGGRKPAAAAAAVAPMKKATAAGSAQPPLAVAPAAKARAKTPAPKPAGPASEASMDDESQEQEEGALGEQEHMFSTTTWLRKLVRSCNRQPLMTHRLLDSAGLLLVNPGRARPDPS